MNKLDAGQAPRGPRRGVCFMNERVLFQAGRLATTSRREEKEG
jgi:hypothetical protein